MQCCIPGLPEGQSGAVGHVGGSASIQVSSSVVYNAIFFIYSNHSGIFRFLVESCQIFGFSTLELWSTGMNGMPYATSVFPSLLLNIMNVSFCGLARRS